MDSREQPLEWRRALLVLFVVSSALFVALNGAVSATGASTRPPAQASDTTENQAQARLAWMREHQTGMWNVAPSEGAFLRDEVVKVNAQRALEIGTSNGYSGIWIALGLRKTGGHLLTLEIDEGRAVLRRDRGRARLLLLDAVASLRAAQELQLGHLACRQAGLPTLSPSRRAHGKARRSHHRPQRAGPAVSDGGLHPCCQARPTAQDNL